MSADNGIYILETPKGNSTEYRVVEAQAIDNIDWSDARMDYSATEDERIATARDYFGASSVFTNENDALTLAYKLEKENNYLEYGISSIVIDREF